MTNMFRNSLTALALGATVLTATPALADPPHRHDRDDRGRDRDRGRDGRWDRDRGRDRVVVVRERQPVRVVRPVRVVHVYDYNRPDPRYRGYYANRYYRGSGYQPIRVTRETRIYRGDDDRYYCRRSDGTTGLIIGAALGGIIGDQLDRGRSSILGAVLGAGAGGLLGREIDRGDVVCR